MLEHENRCESLQFGVLNLLVSKRQEGARSARPSSLKLACCSKAFRKKNTCPPVSGLVGRFRQLKDRKLTRGPNVGKAQIRLYWLKNRRTIKTRPLTSVPRESGFEQGLSIDFGPFKSIIWSICTEKILSSESSKCFFSPDGELIKKSAPLNAD